MAETFISIVIPVWHDADQLRELLAGLSFASTTEVIVVNGDPLDRAVDALRHRFPRVLWSESERGRARQMNHGAAVACGRWLVFLHADVRLSPGWEEEIERADRAGAACGCFRFTLASAAPQARAIERGVRLRVRLLGLPYGDQALFVRRDVFEGLDGYQPLPLMEDVDLVRRLRHAGRLWRSSLPVVISARRWEQDGWFRRSLVNVGLVLLYFGGVSPRSLAHWYASKGTGVAAGRMKSERGFGATDDAREPQPAALSEAHGVPRSKFGSR